MKRNCKENEKWKQLVKTKTYRALLYVENDASIACMMYVIHNQIYGDAGHSSYILSQSANDQFTKIQRSQSTTHL